jgi:hypothetical protein
MWRFLALLAIACAPARPAPETPPVPKPSVDPGAVPRQEVRVQPPPEQDTLRPIAPPELALRNDWMSLGSTGVERFRKQYPTYDGRGVIVGILDTGIDPGAPGLQQTSTGEPKLLDLRDFSDEGNVPLQKVTPRGDTVEVAGQRMLGFGRVASLNAAGPWYAGTLREIPQIGRAHV